MDYCSVCGYQDHLINFNGDMVCQDCFEKLLFADDDIDKEIEVW